MKIAIVHEFLLRFGGAERVLAKLMEMYPDAPVYTLMCDEKHMKKFFDIKRIRTSWLQKLIKFKFIHKAFFPFMPSAIEEFDFTGYDIVISSSSAYAHGIVTNLETKHICYYHSPMRYAWDYTHKYLKEQNLGLIMELFIKKILHKIRQWDFLASDRPDIAIANSKTVQNRIKKYYRKNAQIIHPPVDLARFSPSKKHESYFLIVSTLTPYKKIDIAIELFNKLGKKLVIIGTGSDETRLKNMSAENIDFLGFQSDEAVKEYMENCRAFIFSSEEDFGIAPIEAMACGKPILAFKKGGLTESMIEGKTGEFFEIQSVESMEKGLTQLLINEPHYDHNFIANHAQKYSAERFEKEFKELVENVYKQQS